MRRPATALLLALCTAGPLSACAGEPEAPGDVRVQAGGQDITARPTQYCVDGEGQRYETTPPVVEVSPDTAIGLTVPEEIAERGWQVQVFDESLQEVIGEVDVPDGTETFDGINSSDVLPPAFYLVVVEDSGGDCGEFGAAWPIGFLRAGGDLGT
ncbi:DUF2771 family protein [Blastococcus capsensis]|uniref:DUF2771 family protein n=1 Tax=Blastococcus capsensis TaxID=1564163 RepID=UPI002540E391|nr:DUF2771 family protein [Blastococcus capsensis]MDK3257215.1 DUF2771 family protein [Blastococcus capsensis]